VENRLLSLKVGTPNRLDKDAMNRKRIATIIIVAIVVAVGGYFGLMQLRDTTPVLAEEIGILEPVVSIPDVQPGYDYLVPFTILCGKDQDRTLMVTIEEPSPDKLPDGYVAFPKEYYVWIHADSGGYQGGTWKWDRITFNGELDLGDPIIVEAGHYRHLTLVLTMPDGVDYYGKHAEVRVRVTEIDTQGMNRIAIESKWRIVTASQEDVESS
jgi:hypothetical protein